jgi:hypothetical protein
MSLQASMQCRARQVRDLRLKGIEAAVEPRQGVMPKNEDHRRFGFGQNRRARLSWASFEILDRRPLTPPSWGLSRTPGSAPRAKLAIAVLQLRRRAWSWRCHGELVP